MEEIKLFIDVRKTRNKGKKNSENHNKKERIKLILQEELYFQKTALS